MHDEPNDRCEQTSFPCTPEIYNDALLKNPNTKSAVHFPSARQVYVVQVHQIKQALHSVCVSTCRMQLVMSEAIFACGVSSVFSPCGVRLCSKHDSHSPTRAVLCCSMEPVSLMAVVMRVMQISTTAWSLSLVR